MQIADPHELHKTETNEEKKLHKIWCRCLILTDFFRCDEECNIFSIDFVFFFFLFSCCAVVTVPTNQKLCPQASNQKKKKKKHTTQPNYKCNITCCARIDCRRPNARSTGRLTENGWKDNRRRSTATTKTTQKKTNGFSFFLLSACCDEEYAIKTMEYAKREIIYESSESGQNVFYIKL